MRLTYIQTPSLGLDSSQQHQLEYTLSCVYFLSSINDHMTINGPMGAFCVILLEQNKIFLETVQVITKKVKTVIYLNT